MKLEALENFMTTAINQKASFIKVMIYAARKWNVMKQLRLHRSCLRPAAVFSSFKVLTIIRLKSNTLAIRVFFFQKLTNLEIEKSATDLQLGESMARDHERNGIVINFSRHCALSTQPFWLHLAHMQPENLQNLQNMHFWKKAQESMD